MAFDPISIGAAAGLEVMGGFLNNRFATARQHQAQDFNEQMYGKRYQMEVADLKAAGLNPMLAYMSGAGSVPGSSAASAPGVSASEVYNQHRMVTAQEAKMTAETQKTQQDTKTSSAQERNIDADTLIKSGVPALIAAQVVQATTSAEQSRQTARKIEAEIPRVVQEIEHIKTQIQKNKSDISLNKSLEEVNNHLNALRAVEMYLKNAETRNLNLQGDILEPKKRAAQSWSAEAGAIAENYGKIGSAAWKFLFPSFTQ